MKQAFKETFAIIVSAIYFQYEISSVIYAKTESWTEVMSPEEYINDTTYDTVI